MNPRMITPHTAAPQAEQRKNQPHELHLEAFIFAATATLPPVLFIFGFMPPPRHAIDAISPPIAFIFIYFHCWPLSYMPFRHAMLVAAAGQSPFSLFMLAAASPCPASALAEPQKYRKPRDEPEAV